MVFKLLIIIVLLYFVVRTATNLVRAALADGAPRGRMEPPREEPVYRTRDAAAVETGWRTGAPGGRAGREDIEDAKWQDL